MLSVLPSPASRVLASCDAPGCAVLVVAHCATQDFDLFGNTSLGGLQGPQGVVENSPDPCLGAGKLQCCRPSGVLSGF